MRRQGRSERIVSLPWDASSLVDCTDEPSVFAWGLSDDEAEAVASALAKGNLSRSVSDAPWVMVKVAVDGSVMATASPAYQAGLFWAVDDVAGSQSLLIGPFIGAVVQALQREVVLDEGFAAHKFGLRTKPAPTTPFVGVHRVPPGVILRWTKVGATPHTTTWCGIDAWPDPTLRGDSVLDIYRATFDKALAQLVPADGALAATMSGGLDSTFVVASMTQYASPDRPVHAFVHSPNPRAALRSKGHWDPDDYPIAMAMQQRYPETVRIHRVIGDDRWQPLDEAERSARLLWFPPRNIFNHLWLRQMDAEAHALGASRLLFGAHGNAAFSETHMYAAGYHMARSEWGDVAEIARPYPGEALPGVLVGRELLTRQVVSAAKQRWQHRQLPAHPSAPWVPCAQPQAWTGDGTPRSRYLRWLHSSDHRPSVMAFAGWKAAGVDPFATASMMNLAASIRPSAWARAGSPRGFARQVARGRVPDEIRLRTRRGGQSWDAWFTIHAHRDRYVNAAEQLIADPVLGALVEGAAVRETVLGWPWGRPTAERPANLNPLMDLLCFATSWRTLRVMAAQLRA